ncbi:SulP family inorganic anion transporter [Micromonospora inyonensis]|uniref:SulP family inorganic anion transporter n=1 Tax=Micromonospora inyonensis TaxID=47866 RepID=UPI003CCBD341
MSATVADGMTAGRRHDPDRELFGQGLAAPVFGGIPATAAIARTAVNVRAGAGSKLAALSHAVVLGMVVLAAAPLVGRIPLAALAGVLLATTVRMVQAGTLWALARATRGDAVVLVLTFAVTVLVDLVVAVAVGVGVAVVVALRAVAGAARLERVPAVAGVDDAVDGELMASGGGVDGERVAAEVVYRVDGPLVFAGAHDVLPPLVEVAHARVVILRMSRVSTLDVTGAQVLGEVVAALGRRGVVVLLSGVVPGHDRVLDAVGAVDRLRREGLVFADVGAALARARVLVGGRVPAVEA